jgi:ABC-2 type transport system permease protein
MSKEGVKIVAKKELREMGSNKGSWISAFFFALFFAWSTSLTNVGNETVYPLEGKVLYLSLFIGVFSGFIMCGAVFFREKQTGVIETLLCTPLNLRDIWLGKVIGVALPSYLMALLSVVILAGMASTVASIPALSLILVVELFLVTPLFTAAAIGLVGYMQLAMGMRENRILSMTVFVILFAGLSAMTTMAIEDTSLIAEAVLILLAMAIGLLSLSFALSRRLSKEKIITTIPD